MCRFILTLVLCASLVVPSLVSAQYDGDPGTGEIFQHIPMYKGDRAPYDGILLDGRRYATLKLAELRLQIGMNNLTLLREDYAKLDKVSSECLKENKRLTSRPICPYGDDIDTEEDSLLFLEDNNFWFGAFTGSMIVGIISFLVFASNS